MDKHEGETNCETGVDACATLFGGAKDYHQEEECEYSLSYKCTQKAAILITSCAAVKILAETVGGKITKFAIAALSCDECENSSGNDATNYLRSYIRAKLLARHSAVDKTAKRNRRIEVRAADVSDAIRHCYYRKTEGDSHAKESNRTAGEDGCTTAAKHQCECADALGYHFLC